MHFHLHKLHKRHKGRHKVKKNTSKELQKPSDVLKWKQNDKTNAPAPWQRFKLTTTGGQVSANPAERMKQNPNQEPVPEEPETDTFPAFKGNCST